jgi:hypothetical protein
MWWCKSQSDQLELHADRCSAVLGLDQHVATQLHVVSDILKHAHFHRLLWDDGVHAETDDSFHRSRRIDQQHD